MKYEFKKIILLYGLPKKVIMIKFQPKSNSYKNFGSYIIGTVGFRESEMLEFLSKEIFLDDIYIKFDVLFPEETKFSFHKELAEVGFATSDIYMIEAHV